MLNIIILIALILAALLTVMTRSLLRSALALALTSILVTILMFRLDSPLAAVFELSVCTGLISVLFISTISLTHPLTREQMVKYIKARMHRFWYLPFIVIFLGLFLSLLKFKPDFKLPQGESVRDVGVLLWNFRQLDLMGQIIILLTGVFGVVILFKEAKKK